VAAETIANSPPADDPVFERIADHGRTLAVLEVRRAEFLARTRRHYPLRHLLTCRAHYLIAQRLRASRCRPRSLGGRWFLSGPSSAESTDAKAVIGAARQARIAPATLTRARWKLGLRSVKKPLGWVWTRRCSPNFRLSVPN